MTFTVLAPPVAKHRALPARGLLHVVPGGAAHRRSDLAGLDLHGREHRDSQLRLGAGRQRCVQHRRLDDQHLLLDAGLPRGPAASLDANGQSSVVSETIPVSTPVIPLMQPFPVVRIAGSFNSAGAKIGVLTVLAPVGATVRVTCRGGGCPSKAQSLRATRRAKSKASTVLVRFRRFERSLRAGVVLDVWVSDAGELGKFTRFVIRRDKAPTRTDLCLNPAGTVPLVCPAS